MERDRDLGDLCRLPAVISIHALRMERDPAQRCFSWRAYDFNPRAPHGARLQKLKALLEELEISIHALRMERDAR